MADLIDRNAIKQEKIVASVAAMLVISVLVMRAVKKILFLYFTSSTMIMKLS